MTTCVISVRPNPAWQCSYLGNPGLLVLIMAGDGLSFGGLQRLSLPAWLRSPLDTKGAAGSLGSCTEQQMTCQTDGSAERKGLNFNSVSAVCPGGGTSVFGPFPERLLCLLTADMSSTAHSGHCIYSEPRIPSYCG